MLLSLVARLQRQCQRRRCYYLVSEALLSCFCNHYSGNSFFGETISWKHFFCVWNRRHWKNLRTIVLSQDFLHAPLQWVNRESEFMMLLIYFNESHSNFSLNFFCFILDTIEKQCIINLISRCSKSYTSVVLGDSEITFLREGKDPAFCPFFCFFFLNTERWINEEVCDNTALSFNTALSSYSVNCSGLMSYLFIRDFRTFRRRFLKCSFHFRNLSSGLVAFTFALEMLFLPLFLLPAMLIMIVYLLPNFWFYWFGLECCSFWNVLVCSSRDFLTSVYWHLCFFH